MKKRWISVIISVLLPSLTSGQTFWQERTENLASLRASPETNIQTRPNFKTSAQRNLSADFTSLREVLSQLNQSGVDFVELDLPLPDGRNATYRFTLSPIASENFLAKHPDLLAFIGVDSQNPANSGRFDLSPLGFRGMFHHDDKLVVIDPISQASLFEYASYYATNALPLAPRSTSPIEHGLTGISDKQHFAPKARSSSLKDSSAHELKTYRLAITASSGYTQYHGGKTSTLAELHTLVNRVNDIYQRDLGIRLELIGRQEELIITDANNDPFTNNPMANLDANQTFVDNLIGGDHYDIGHLVSTQGGGLAFSGVCNSQFKAKGQTGFNQPKGDLFYIDYVAHEMGHQFNAPHSFNGTTENCTGNNREAGFAYEPGSGSTIMGYAGICGAQNLQDRTDAYFHASSIAVITQYITTGEGEKCGSASQISNLPPVVDAGADFTIPHQTPFILSGSASDPESDALTYTWEQMDLGSASTTPSSMIDDGSRPLFRSWLPTASATRYLPRLTDVAAGTTVLGESYPNQSRDLNFRLTVRQAAAAQSNVQPVGTGFDDVVVKVDSSAGPFALSYPNSAQNWQTGETRKICWAVANTDKAPISCPYVDILLSSDGGNSFTGPILEKATLNDGDANILVPNDVVTNGRLIVRCSNERFFTMSQTSLALNTNSTTNIDSSIDCSSVTPPAQPAPPVSSSATTSSSSTKGSAGSLSGVFWLMLLLIFISRHIKRKFSDA